jgi:hypothetical protein
VWIIVHGVAFVFGFGLRRRLVIEIYLRVEDNGTGRDDSFLFYVSFISNLHSLIGLVDCYLRVEDNSMSVIGILRFWVAIFLVFVGYIFESKIIMLECNCIILVSKICFLKFMVTILDLKRVILESKIIIL